MFIDDKLKEELKRYFSPLSRKVKLLYFTQEFECQFCKETRELLSELADVSEKIQLEVRDFKKDEEEANRYSIDKIPAIVMLDKSDEDYGVRFFGIPSGYEFTSLLEAIIMMGTGKTNLSNSVIEKINSIAQPVRLQVFVTPTCPYCPKAVIAAHKFAYLNKNIKADMIEATEFPHLSNKYNVRGVPRTVINEFDFIEGAAPEEMILEKIFSSLKTA